MEKFIERLKELRFQKGYLKHNLQKKPDLVKARCLLGKQARDS